MTERKPPTVEEAMAVLVEARKLLEPLGEMAKRDDRLEFVVVLAVKRESDTHLHMSSCTHCDQCALDFLDEGARMFAEAVVGGRVRTSGPAGSGGLPC